MSENTENVSIPVVNQEPIVENNENNENEGQEVQNDHIPETKNIMEKVIQQG